MGEADGIGDRTSIAFVGNYLPRRCGIATFTHDLCEAVAGQAAGISDVFAVAINDVPEGYAYPPRVRFEIRQNVQQDYRLAAEFLNMNQVSAVCLQHEYGIFGGTCGSHLLSLLRRVRRPIVTTLHTVLKDPTDEQKLVLQEVIRLSDRVVVMAEMARTFLREVYQTPNERIAVIPHGIPDVPFVDPHFYKDQFGVEGRTVLLTFGLLSPGKGLEYVIDALPRVVRAHPELTYILLGATHPHVRAQCGEEYRNSLMRRVHELGLKEHVIFVNRFVELKELCEYLGAAELYVTPYLHEAQITSGTLAYAMGAGKAVVSTPYWHATEMLADGRGRIVPFRDAESMGGAILELLDNEAERNAVRKRAYAHCRPMVWRHVAQDYLDLFTEATQAWVQTRHHTARMATPRRSEKFDLPDIDLRHMRILTDSCGVLQHCRYSTPDRNHGYCTDDNARALIVAGHHWTLRHDTTILPLMQQYLSFLAYAMNEETGRFRNFMRYDRTWIEKSDSEDSQGRALWGLGEAVALCPHESMIALAAKLFTQGLAVVEEFTSPRAWAFTLCGIHAYLRRFGGDSDVRRMRGALAEKLLALFRKTASDDWPWCEDTLAYANAKLAHVLLMCGKWMQNGEMVDRGQRALRWLCELQTSKSGHFRFIGTQGWHSRGQESPARYDQQPIEAFSLVDACIEAYHVTREPYWVEQAKKAFYWFLGENDLRTPLYDFTTGGCRDGLHSDSANENQGAESTLAWLMSLLLMHDLQVELSLEDIPATRPESRGPRGVAAPVITSPLATPKVPEEGD